MEMKVQRLDKVLLQWNVPMRTPLPQHIPNLLRGLVILPRQRQVEPECGAIRSASPCKEILAEAAQQGGLPCAFVACDSDEAWRKGEQIDDRHDVRTMPHGQSQFWQRPQGHCSAALFLLLPDVDSAA